MADESPTVRRRRLGLILRRLREGAGLTGEDAGGRIERSGSWISRVETGRVGVRARDLRELLDVYGVDDPAVADELTELARAGKQRGWWSSYGDVLSGPYAAYIGFEAEATELLVYDTFVVPGLLQTEDYARVLFGTAIPPNSEELINRKVEVRLARQELLRQGQPPRLWVILDESVLRRLGDRDVLRKQLDQLIEMADLPHVTIQVLCFDSGGVPGMVGSFVVVRFPSADDPDLVYIEGVSRDTFEEAEDANRYREVFDHLRAAALEPAESRKWLQRARDDVA